MTKRSATIAACVALVAILGLTGISIASATDDDTPTVGTIPPDAFSDTGSLDADRVPEFVVTSGRDGEPVGFTAKKDLVVEEGRTSAQQDINERTPVYGDDLKTVVGHMYAGVGFVAIGESPPEHPSPPTTDSPPAR